ncbi:2-amino-4-hydroxy-6-hydroxymethyldihydropteridine diphosphokinase [Belliella kenyensis]|uniref:2-amino-4-hydroxy-6-hydroxymethyldihydropteridine pyrophosphokinase n=1 Tax=Belliella kenyensis TaxID=1472724 RepID=A0ABV8EPD7_9BACT|nr:2-amino-4-hydroxy-6-hydroxymethyldihydropteridine diphosphokinase [Belliella kenyensis]MCH7400695.1 2-amino-4-hydroxy-6-hydroxymethyldihydropteridine diphosphokinase [Belliella kenyensis]MDN3602018.1 2-amino-4-hydroxy-6-hydroxymethyldihydropteridine diphosphokinase [Belliella kenyensis]
MDKLQEEINPLHQVVLLIGGNLGDRFRLIADAKRKILKEIGEVKKQSSLYETAAWGEKSTMDFINQALLIYTTLSAQEVLHVALSIEKSLGRERVEKWGDRTMDIDVIFYGDSIIDEPDLIIPHPFMKERKFVLVPIVEILPDWIHPVLKMSMKEMLSACEDQCDVREIREGE